MEDERPSPARNIEQLEKGVEENSRMMVEVKREVGLFRVKSRGGESTKCDSERAEESKRDSQEVETGYEKESASLLGSEGKGIQAFIEINGRGVVAASQRPATSYSGEFKSSQDARHLPTPPTTKTGISPAWQARQSSGRGPAQEEHESWHWKHSPGEFSSRSWPGEWHQPHPLLELSRQLVQSGWHAVISKRSLYLHRKQWFAGKRS